MARVSIILPYRDAVATLKGAVQSILAQDFRDLELIVVDDGSADASAACLEGINDPRIICLENRAAPGIVGALETGLGAAGGDWVARMDADDWSWPARIGRQMELAERRPELGVISCGATLVDGCGEGMQRYVEWVNSLQTAEEIARSRFIECPLIHPTAMIRVDGLRRVGGWRECGWAEDHDLWLRLLENGCQFGKVPEVLFDWRDSPQRLTRIDARYGTVARTAMRAYFLSRLAAVQAGGVVIAGAGPIGKALARALIAEGVVLRGFFEVNSRKIGQRIHGAEVAGIDALNAKWGDAVLLGAVGLRGGREKVRAWAQQAQTS